MNRFNPDESAYRTGIQKSVSVVKTMLDEVEKARHILSVDRVKEKFCMTVEMLDEVVGLLRAAVMIGYPAYHGLPLWEPARAILEGSTDFAQV